MESVKFISYGILSNIICCLGIICNTLTLYILNASKGSCNSELFWIFFCCFWLFVRLTLHWPRCFHLIGSKKRIKIELNTSKKTEPAEIDLSDPHTKSINSFGSNMRKPSINIYLTVLAIYDNGVLIFSVLMLNIPAITDYHLMLQQQQQQQQMTSILFENQTTAIGPDQIKTQTTISAVDAISNQTMMLAATNDPLLKINLNGNDDYSKRKIASPHPTGLINSTWIVTDSHYNHSLPVGSAEPIVPQQYNYQLGFDDNNDFSQTLNMILESFKTDCLSEHRSVDANSGSKNVQYSNQAQFHSVYCQLLFTLNNNPVDDDDGGGGGNEADHFMSASQPFQDWIIQPNVQCESILNQLIELLNRLDQEELDGRKLSRLGIISVDVNHTNHLSHEVFMLLKSIPLLILEQNPEQEQPSNTTVTYDQLCRSNECPPVDYTLSPLVYYVKIVYPLALIAQTGSIWTTCLITIERYLAVCYPLMTMSLSTRARAIWALSILSILAILFNLPRFAEVDTTCHQVRATKFRRNKIYYQVYYIFLNLSFNYILPLSLLSALNIKIYASVRKASTDRSQLTRARQSELHMASMLVAIVAIFIACNAPAFIVNCLEPYFEVGTPVLELVTIFSNVLVCLNSSINFVIYCIFGRKFRLKFTKLLRLHRLIVCFRRFSHSGSRSHSLRSTRCGVTFDAASCSIHPDLHPIKSTMASNKESENIRQYQQNQRHNDSLTNLAMLKSNRQCHQNPLVTKFDWSTSDATVVLPSPQTQFEEEEEEEGDKEKNDPNNSNHYSYNHQHHHEASFKMFLDNGHKNGYNHSNFSRTNNIMIVDMNNVEKRVETNNIDQCKENGNKEKQQLDDDHNHNLYCDNIFNKHVHNDIGDGPCSKISNPKKYQSKNFALYDQVTKTPLLTNPKKSSLQQRKTSANDVAYENNHNFDTFV